MSRGRFTRRSEPRRSGQVDGALARRGRFASFWTGPRVVVSALVVIALNLGFLSFHLWSSPAPAPAYGEPMPEWRAEALDGRWLEGAEFFRGRHGVLIYAERTPSEPLVRYLQVLLDRYRDHGAGLRAVLALGPDHLDRSAAERVARSAAYPVVYDADGELRRLLHLRPHTDHSFLVGADGRMTFSASELLTRDELRQHVEKHLLGEIQYSASAVTLLGPKARLPSYRVVRTREVDGDHEQRLYSPSAGTTVVVIPAAMCGLCNPVALYEQIAGLHDELCGGDTRECRLELLVTAGYPIDDLTRALSDSGVRRVPVYRALDGLVGLEDEYYTKRREEGADGLVLLLGADRKVLEVARLAERMEETDGA